MRSIFTNIQKKNIQKILTNGESKLIKLKFTTIFLSRFSFLSRFDRRTYKFVNSKTKKGTENIYNC